MHLIAVPTMKKLIINTKGKLVVVYYSNQDRIKLVLMAVRRKMFERAESEAIVPRTEKGP
jgi:hypothetical protein